MKSSSSRWAHSRPDRAHGPEPLAASGMAQACPSCLPSPSHQRTFHGDLRSEPPKQRGERFASRHSAIGVFTVTRLRAELLPPSEFPAGPSRSRDGLDLPASLLWPSHRTNAKGRRTRRTSAFFRYPPAVQRDEYRCRVRRFSRSKPHRGSPHEFPMEPLSRNHRAETRSPKTDSRTSAYLIQTAILLPAFNRVSASRHLSSTDLTNPVRRFHVSQDSDFRRKSRGRKKLRFSFTPPGVRRPSERLAIFGQFPSVNVNT